MKTIHYNEAQYASAKKKVERIKGFYRHLVVYLSINMIITSVHTVHVMRDGLSLMDAVWNLQTFFNWVPWGIGLLIHGIVVLNVPSLLMGKNWEDRKIKEILEKDRKNSSMNWE